MPIHSIICHNPACQIEFEARRSDAKFCSSACRKAYNRSKLEFEQQTKKEQAEKEATILKEIEMCHEAKRLLLKLSPIQEIASSINEYHLPQIKPKTTEQDELEKSLDDYQWALQLTGLSLYRFFISPTSKVLHVRIPPHMTLVHAMRNRETVFEPIFNEYLRCSTPETVSDIPQKDLPEAKASVDSFREWVRNEIEIVGSRIKELEEARKLTKEDIAKNNLHASIFRAAKTTNIPAKLREADSKLAKLEKQLEEVRQPKELTESPVPKPRPHQTIKRRRGGKSKGLAPAELRKMEFQTLDLSTEGELGEFLGYLEPKLLAIALIGDPTAGKSTFSFRLAKVFLNIGMRVKYFSIEEGVGRLTHEKLDRAEIEDHDQFEIVGTGNLIDIRKEAKDWDVVVVDSWSVLDEKPEQYNKLRTDFPDTIFIVIFQKTSTGTIRGGSKIIFDTPVCINVVREGLERIAEMKKSRYGTQGWRYSITEDELIESL